MKLLKFFSLVFLINGSLLLAQTVGIWDALVSEDMAVPLNWALTRQLPNGDPCFFPTDAATNSPFLNSTPFSPASFTFDPTVTTFTFTINNALSFSSGLTNNSASSQIFNISNGGSVTFDGGSGNDGTGATVIYNVDTGCTLDFNSSSTTGNTTLNGNAGIINLADGTGSPLTTVNLQNGALLNAGNVLLGHLNGLDSTTVVNLNGTVELSSGLSIAGLAQGAGGFTIDSGASGVFESSAMATYTGTTTVNAGGTLAFDQSNQSTFASPLAGAGALTINSPKIFFTVNSSAFTGLTTISSGADLVLENILGGSVIDNGTLTASATILGNLTVNPGGLVFLNSPTDTLTVDGNYLQTGATLETTVNGAGQSGLLDVGGSLTLAGSNTLLLTTVDTYAGRYHVAHAGAVVGTFTTVEATGSTLTPRAIYTTTDIFVQFGTAFSALARTFNERQVAAQIDSTTSSDPALQAAIAALLALPVGSQLLALDQMTGQQYATTLLTTEFENEQFLRELYDPLRPFIADPCSLRCCPCNSWAEATVGHAHWFGTANASSISLNDYEISIGTQKGFSREMLFGVALSYEHEDITYKVIGGHGTSNSALASLYGLYRAPCFYLLGDLILGYTHQSIHRRIDIGALHYRPKGSLNVFQSTLYFEGGKDFWFQGILIQPFAGIEAGYYTQGRVHETTGTPFDLSVRSRDYWPAYSRLGLHFSKLCSTFFVGLDTAWQYRLTSSQNHIEEMFNIFGTTFPIHGFHLPRNAFDADLYIGKFFGRGSYFLQGGIQTANNAFAYEGLIGVNFKL